MLDAHHRSAAGGTSKSGMVKADEVLGAQPVEKLSGPIVMIRLKPEYESNRAKVQEIANNIEVMKLKQFVTSLQIFFEKFGEVVHPKYVDENKLIAEFMKLNPIMKPSNLARWCIRFAINKTTLILKNMSVETIVNRLRDIYPEIFVVYNSENSSQIVIRVYMQNSLFKQVITVDTVSQFKDQLLDTTIRGIDGILSTTVVKMPRNQIGDDGAIVRKDDIYVIHTNGTNLAKIMMNPFVNPLYTHSDAVREIEKVLGIEAARQKIITEMRNLVDACNYTHYTMYADEMTQNGRVTNIKRSGLSARESSNMHLRIAFSSPLQTLEEAALTAAKDNIGGFSAPLLVGTVPKIGTLYTKIIINEEFVRENVKKASEYLDEL
jgi:DNA-directed RNA polymerase II subunit RPB1